MTKVHEYNFCPSCGQKLQGDETLCPFCGYRLLENKEGIETVPVQEQEEKSMFCPACNTRMEPGERVCSFCGFRPDGLQVPEDKFRKKTPQEEDDGVPPIAEVPHQDKVIDLKPKSQPDTLVVPPVNQQTPATTTPPVTTDAVPPRKRKWGLIIGLLLAALFVVAALLVILQATGAAEIPGINGLFKKEPVIVTPPAVTRNYYYCYASTLIGKKTTVLMSNVFIQDKAGNSVRSAEAAFRDAIRLKYPKDYQKFKPILTKQFRDSASGNKDRDAVKASYLKKKYEFRFVDINP